MKHKRLIGPGLVLLALACAALWYLLPGKTEQNTLVLYGNVDIRQVELGFRVAGRVQEMRFEEGDAVKEKDVLAVLDKTPYLDEAALRKAEVEQQEANLRKLEAGTRPAEIEQARALVAERKASLVNANRAFDRQQELVRKGVVSRKAYDDALAQKTEAEARVKSVEKAFDLAQEGFRKEDIAQGRAALDAAKARLQEARTRLADTGLAAPADGIILVRVVEPGAIAATGATVYTLSLQRPVWVRAYVSEPNLGRIHPGMAVEVITDTKPGKAYAGQIGFISPVAEFTPKSVETAELRSDLVYRLRVIVREPDKALRQGMPVTVRIPLSASAAGGNRAGGAAGQNP